MERPNPGRIVFPVGLERRTIEFDADTAGTRVPFTINGVQLEIVFPALISNKETDLNPFRMDFANLDSNPNAALAEIGLTSEQFGYVTRHRDEDSGPVARSILVAAFLIRTVGDHDATDIEAVDSIIDDVLDLLNRAIAWLEILKFSDFSERTTGNLQRVQHLFIQRGNEWTIEPRTGIRRIMISYEAPINTEDLVLALEMAMNKVEPEAYHALLISALRYARRSQYRYSILDAASATELGLIKLNEELLESEGIADKKQHFKKHRGMIKLRKAIGRLGGEAPFDEESLKEVIAEPRNSAMHRGSEVGKETAFAAVEFARSFIYGRFPPAVSE